jgi:hypothetical protein
MKILVPVPSLSASTKQAPIANVEAWRPTIADNLSPIHVLGCDQNLAALAHAA